MGLVARVNTPLEGTVEPRAFDLPRAGAGLQWWYFNAHLDAGGREFSLFASFFMAVTGRDEMSGATRCGHALTWAITDVDAGSCYQDSRVDHDAPAVGLAALLRSAQPGANPIARAMTETLKRDVVPLPDRLFAGPVTIGDSALDLRYGRSRLTWEGVDGYRLTLDDARGTIGCDLVFEPRRRPVLHGSDGLIRGLGSDQMFYCTIPHCSVGGTLMVGGESFSVEHGLGWYDREFSESDRAGPRSAGAEPGHQLSEEYAWTWLSVHLENGTDLCAYEAFARSGERVEKQLLIVEEGGSTMRNQAFELTSDQSWCSPRTFQEYPTRYRLRAADLGLDLTLEATVADQEFLTVIAKPAFWEGSCRVCGSAFGHDVRGAGFVERSGFGVVDDLESLSAAVGAEVRSALDQVVPHEPSYETVRLLIASREHDHYLTGVDLPTLTANLIAPIREIADRGGKAWRPYAVLVCCAAVGGDSREFVKWLAAPELLHVGSMMVDDVQDRSTVRRGGPAAHLLYGDALAINAGTAAYFLAERVLADNDLAVEKRLRLYELYFLALRAGHAGQALDLAGVAGLMPAVVRTGDANELIRRLLACRRLKTAVPVASLAAMGALVGGGNDAQIDALSAYMEAVALGFQVVDDLLDVRGFMGERKTKGDDIRNGVVTLPVAFTMERLDARSRSRLWEQLSASPMDDATVTEVAAVLEECGALAACEAYASDLVEAGWRRVEHLLEPSFYTVMLRALGWFVVERRH